MHKKDFQSDQVVKWCPGCGDYAILSSVQNALVKLGQEPDQVAFISGIGCSSRFPYYMNTYGFHTVHGRAPTIATGLKIANPDLNVWIITGDGDGLSIGGNHLLHILRRNLDVNILLFNNQIYGLTKGQYSPTSEKGIVTKSSPMGSIEEPLQPVQLAMASGATFIARTYDANPKHMTETFIQAAKHRGTSFIEILQNCVIFNDKVYEPITSRDIRLDKLVHMEEGEPLVYGKDNDKGLFLNGLEVKSRALSSEDDRGGLLIHQPQNTNPGYSNLIASIIGGNDENLPIPVGVFRKIEKPTYENMLMQQIDDAQVKRGSGKLKDLFSLGDTWKV